MPSQLKIVDAIPQIFRRAYPAIDPRTEVLPALSLLRFHEIDALPLSLDSELKHRAVFGLSCLVRLTQLGVRELAPFLRQPCESISEPIATVQSSQSLSVLLNTFGRTRFGFARVEQRRDVGALAGLSDILGLFEKGSAKARLRVKDVASPKISVSKDCSIGSVLQEMFVRRVRRLFIAGTSEFIWDRGIIANAFNPEVLSQVLNGRSRGLLEAPITEFETTQAKGVRSDLPLKEAAAMLEVERGQCLVFDGSVVTPWDVVMKPWKARKLRLG